jgi:hypothetical protein
MATELQRQIAQLKAKQLNADAVHKGRPSLFLTPQEAAAVDVEEVYDAGLGGLHTLQQYDDRFAVFSETLFHPRSVRTQRELKSSEENKTLDQQLASLLRLLSLFVTEKPAHMVLEYLIRRFRIHELNVDELLKCIISIHDTKVQNEFAEMMVVRLIDDSIFDSLDFCSSGSVMHNPGDNMGIPAWSQGVSVSAPSKHPLQELVGQCRIILVDKKLRDVLNYADYDISDLIEFGARN